MSSADSADPIEQIPNEDAVSRAYFGIPLGLAPDTFQFQYDSARDERAESVYWRKYAPQIEDVHARGCRLEAKWRAKSSSSDSRPKNYVGARTAGVLSIREIVTQRGYSFSVFHYPQDGDLAHTHVAIKSASGAVRKLKLNDERELASLLADCFRDFRSHECQN